jgi:putative membrane protein
MTENSSLIQSEPPSQTQLSVDRTYLSHERTLMAWTRTAASLISFGFTIYKFFEGAVDPNRPHHVLGYRTFAGAMISTGIISLLLATLQHRRDTKRLEREFHLKPRYLATLTAGLIGLLGFFGLASVFFRQ